MRSRRIGQYLCAPPRKEQSPRRSRGLGVNGQAQECGLFKDLQPSQSSSVFLAAGRLRGSRFCSSTPQTFVPKSVEMSFQILPPRVFGQQFLELGAGEFQSLASNNDMIPHQILYLLNSANRIRTTDKRSANSFLVSNETKLDPSPRFEEYLSVPHLTYAFASRWRHCIVLGSSTTALERHEKVT